MLAYHAVEERAVV